MIPPGRGVIVTEGRAKDPANGKGISAHEAGKSLVNAEVGSKGLWEQYVSRDPARKGHGQAYSRGRRARLTPGLTWRAREHRGSITPGLVEARPFKWAGFYCSP